MTGAISQRMENGQLIQGPLPPGTVDLLENQAEREFWDALERGEIESDVLLVDEDGNPIPLEETDLEGNPL